MTEKNACPCCNTGTCKCNQPRPEGECCCGPTCKCPPDCGCPASCGCDAARARRT
ncbi:MAG: hypothetical protein JNK05_00325 [Myxococcales bacterium]|nr:hypothetical protein [Myxococcales bacterium]